MDMPPLPLLSHPKRDPMKDTLAKARENWPAVLGTIGVVAVGVFVFTGFIGLFQLDSGPDAGWPPLWVYGTLPAFAVAVAVVVTAVIGMIWDADF